MALDYSQLLGLNKAQPNPLQMALSSGQAASSTMQNMIGLAMKKKAMDAQSAKAAYDAEERAAYKKDLLSFIDNDDRSPADAEALQLKYPTQAKNIRETLEFSSDAARKSQIESMIEVRSALRRGDNEGAIKSLEQKKDAALEAGDEDLARRYEVGAANVKLNPKVADATMTLVLTEVLGAEKVADIDARVEDNLVDRETRDARISLKKSDATIKGVEAKYAERKIQAAIRASGMAASNVDVQSSKIHDDGSVTLVGKDKSVITIPPNEVTRAAVAASTQIQKDRSQGRREGTLDANIDKGARSQQQLKKGDQAVALSGDAYKRAAGLGRTLGVLKEGLAAVSGPDAAWAGWLAKKLPSFRQKAAELDNVVGRLTIEAINSATFGALSERELLMLKETAMPQNLDAAGKKEWLEKRIKVVSQLQKMLTRQAKYLQTHTLDEWIDHHSGGVSAPPSRRRNKASGAKPKDVNSILNKYGGG